MRVRIWVAALLSAMLLCGVLRPASFATAQSTEATPSPSPEATGAPKFVLTAVGDYPNDYFDDVEIAPGHSADLVVAVQNLGREPVSLRISRVDALNGINGGFVSGDETAEPTGSTTWIDFPEQVIDLAPGERIEIPFTVSVPDGTAPGQYISGLVARTANPLAIPGVGALDHTIGYAISVGILVPGELAPEFQLGTPEVEVRSEDAALRVPVINTGNYLVRPSGDLILTNTEGEQVLASRIEMKSVYGGFSAPMEIVLPGQLPAGDYTLDLSLADDASGATAQLDDVPVSVPAAPTVRGIVLTRVSIEANADPIDFAAVDLELNNDGSQLPSVAVMLDVLRDGAEIDSFPLATNQMLLHQENTITARYVPVDGWQPGTYTFRITVSSVDPQGGTETVLLEQDIEPAIVVP